MIFQEPMTSLNPVFTIGDQIIETVRLHQRVSSAQAKTAAVLALQEVGIDHAEARLRAYPHEFSGGMRQRVMIAMALACRPKLLLADEPTTALDVTIQQQILTLLRRLQHERGMGMVLITHDLGVVAQHADVVCVMYAGRIMEYASVFDLFAHPLHPYTRGLLSCKPDLSRRSQRLTTVDEIVNDPDQFMRLKVGGGALRPWWPHSGEHGALKGSTQAESNRIVMSEVEANHWVGCHANHVADYLAARRPDLNFCRDEKTLE
jgi:ABC-type dipeptide/oligopeptide/nickel transport system ATPase component